MIITTKEDTFIILDSPYTQDEVIELNGANISVFILADLGELMRVSKYDIVDEYLDARVLGKNGVLLGWSYNSVGFYEGKIILNVTGDVEFI